MAKDNPKGNLQEAVQAKGNEPIEYQVLNVDGPDHAREFKIAVFIGGKRKGTGVGNSKKKSRRNRCREGLQADEINPNTFVFRN